MNYYQLLYSLNIPKLIGYFWFRFNTGKIKSKNRVARYVLHHYYCSLPREKQEKSILFDYFERWRIEEQIKIAKTPWLDTYGEDD